MIRSSDTDMRCKSFKPCRNQIEPIYLGNKDGNPWPYPATNDTASLCGMRETKKGSGSLAASVERLPPSPLVPPPRRPPLVNGGACGRVFAFYPAQSAQPLARVACHECEDLCSTLYFPAQSCWAALYSDPFKVHFACNYGAELLKQK